MGQRALSSCLLSGCGRGRRTPQQAPPRAVTVNLRVVGREAFQSNPNPRQARRLGNPFSSWFAHCCRWRSVPALCRGALDDGSRGLRRLVAGARHRHESAEQLHRATGKESQVHRFESHGEAERQSRGMDCCVHQQSSDSRDGEKVAELGISPPNQSNLRNPVACEYCRAHVTQ